MKVRMTVSDFSFFCTFLLFVFFSLAFLTQEHVVFSLSKHLAVIRNNRRLGEQLSQKCRQQQRYCVLQQLNVGLWQRLSVQNNIPRPDPL